MLNVSFLFSHIKKFDWVLITSVFLICAISLLQLWSIDKGNQGSSFFSRQLFFVGIGIFLLVALSFLDLRIFKNYPLFLLIVYFISLLILAAVLFLGHQARGTTGWFQLGNFNFEPVELGKITLILLLAKYFSNRHVEVYRIRHIIISGIYAALLIGLVLLQPDLGSALILISIWLGIVVLSGIKLRHLIIVLLIGALCSTIAWSFALKNYQKERIMTFINPATDPLGYSYNLNQAKIAIGSGGLLGKGLGQGSQGRLNFLPEKQSDFIFASFAEEWGFVGVLVLLTSFALLIFRLIKLTLICSNNFFRLFVAGFAIMIFVQLIINVGMNLGLLPVTGITLPFVSYGGSSLLVNFLGLGLVLNIGIQTRSEVQGISKIE